MIHPGGRSLLLCVALLCVPLVVGSASDNPRVLDYASSASRWDRSADGESVSRLGILREGETSILRQTILSDGEIRFEDRARVRTGTARIRTARAGRDAFFLFITDGGAELPAGLYRVPHTSVGSGSIREYRLDKAGRVASPRDFDRIDLGPEQGGELLVVAHRTATGGHIVAYDQYGASAIITGLPSGTTFGDVRVVQGPEPDLLLLSFRSYGQTQQSELHAGYLRVRDGSPDSVHVFEEHARLPGAFFSVFGSSQEGPRTPLRAGAAYRDAGHDLAVLEDGSFLVAYQYIETMQTALTRPAAGLNLAHIQPEHGTTRIIPVVEAATNRFALSPWIAPMTGDVVRVLWIAEQHPQFFSDAFRADIDLSEGTVSAVERVSTTPRMVSDVATAGTDVQHTVWIQHEPRAQASIIMLGRSDAGWLRERPGIPRNGLPAEDLAAVLLGLPIAVLAGLYAMVVPSLPALAGIFLLVRTAYRRTPELVRRSGVRLIPALCCLYGSLHGLSPFSFTAQPDPLLLVLACAAATLLGALMGRAGFPRRGSSAADMMKPILGSAVLFHSILAYPAVMSFLAALNTFVY